jgi:microcystin-dependent protein
MTSLFLTTGFTTNNVPSSITPAPSTDLGSLFQLILPVGTVLPFAGNVLPPNFLWCDGGEYDRTIYNSLYTAIGLTYGYTTNSNFKVPDLKGRTPFGAKNIPNRTIDVNLDPQTTGGNAKIQAEQLAAHQHEFPSGSSGFVGWGSGFSKIQTGSNGLEISHTEFHRTDTATNDFHNDYYPPFTVLNFMIKFN